MKLSIWRQFSSNHSGDFHIIGEFATEAEAQLAGEKLQQILDQLEAYYTQDESEEFDLAPKSAEKSIAETYDVEIETAIDWVYNDAKHRAFRVYDNVLLLSSLYQQQHSGIPNVFPDLLMSLNANVTRTTFGACLVTVEFDVPNTDLAMQWETQIRAYHQSTLTIELFYYPPWIGYYLGKHDAELEQLAQHWESTRELVEVKEAQVLLDIDGDNVLTEYDSWLQGQYEADRQNAVLQSFRQVKASEHHPLRDNLNRAIGDIGFPLHYVFKNCTEIIRTDKHLKLQRLSFGSPGCGLEAVIAWAKAHDCTNISYGWEIADNCWEEKS